MRSLRTNAEALAEQPPQLVIGALGDSITYGAGVGHARAWPALLDASLRRVHGGAQAVRVRNGAVRASSADFAALCWEAIWAKERQQQQRTTRFPHEPSAPSSHARKQPRVGLAIVDYSYASSPLQVSALVDRLRALRIPTIVSLYCPHHDWHVAWQAHDAERRGAWRWGGRRPDPRNRTAPLVRDTDPATFLDFAARKYVAERSAEREAEQHRRAPRGSDGGARVLRPRPPMPLRELTGALGGGCWERGGGRRRC